jgi:hypothetical protein
LPSSSSPSAFARSSSLSSSVPPTSPSSARSRRGRAAHGHNETTPDRATWSQLWALRCASSGTPEYEFFCIGLFCRLQADARWLYAVVFPRTDPSLREHAWTRLWERWCKKPPAPHLSLDDDKSVQRYVNRSLVNSMYSTLRERVTGARLRSECAFDIEQTVHSGGAAGKDASASLEQAEHLADVRRMVAFFRSDLSSLLSDRRAGRTAEVVRLVGERLEILSGEKTFAEVVAASAAPGEAARTVENRLRQRYGRALHDVLRALDAHAAALVARGHDPDRLQLFALQLFSDRSGAVMPRVGTRCRPAAPASPVRRRRERN